MLGRLGDQPGGGADEPDVGGDGAGPEERVASTTRRDAGRAMARVRPNGAELVPPAVVRIRRGHDATAVRRGARSDHPVAQRQKGGPVGRHDHGATDHQPAHGGQHALLGGAVEIGGGLVEEEEGRVPDKGPGQGHPLALPRRQARPRRLPSTVARPSGSPATTSSSPASLMAGRRRRRWRRVGRVARCRRWSGRRDAVRCGTQATWVLHASGSRSARSMPPTVTEPPEAGTRPRRTPRRVDLPQPLGPAMATTSPGSTESETSRRAGSVRPG